VIKILQFTDLHLRCALPGHNGHIERRSRQIPLLLERMATRIAEEAPDLVVLTGDLLDVPHALLDGDSRFDLHAYAAAAVRDYRLLADWLGRLGRPWVALPGNHDHPASFYAVFADAPRSLRLGPLAVHAFHDWEQTGNQARRLKDERGRFEAALATAGGAAWSVHLQHYVIWPRVDYGYPLLYGDADELAGRLAEAPGRHLVLSGHWHGGTPLAVHGGARFAVCPAFCEPPHPYRIYTLTDDGAVNLREGRLGPLPASGRLVVLDRGGLLTRQDGTEGSLALRPEAAAMVARLEAQGAAVAFTSAWNDPVCRHATWRGVMNLHDALFAQPALAATPGAALAICLPYEQRAGRRLPAEPVAAYEDVLPRLGRLFGTRLSDMLFLSADPARRRIARAAGAAAPELEGEEPALDRLTGLVAA